MTHALRSAWCAWRVQRCRVAGVCVACGRAEARTLSTDEGGDMMRAAREVAQTRWELGGTNDSGGMDEEGRTDEGGDICCLARLPQNKPSQGGQR